MKYGRVFGGVDAQLAGETVLKVAQCVGFAADAVKQRRGTLEKLLSRFGGRHGAGGTVQQLHASRASNAPMRWLNAEAVRPAFSPRG